jgi:RNA polymerase sigma-70 factor (ECF subfamily)
VTDDAALLRAAAAGDAAAFATFLQAHQGATRRHLRAFTGHDEVEDALQEAFFAAWRAAGRFRGPGSARGWLFTIARNAVRHQHRRRVHEPAVLESLESLAERGGWGALPAAPDASEDGMDAALVTDALAHLPEAEREVLTLRELEGLSGEETAALLGISLAAMKSRLHRARLHLAALVRAAHATGRVATRPGRAHGD